MSWPARLGTIAQPSGKQGVLYASGTNNIGGMDKNTKNLVLTPLQSNFYYGNITRSFVSTSRRTFEYINVNASLAVLSSDKKICYFNHQFSQTQIKKGLTQYGTGSNWFKVEQNGYYGLGAIDVTRKNIWYANSFNLAPFVVLNTGSFQNFQFGEPLNETFPSPTLIAHHTNGTLWARGNNTYGLMGDNSVVSYYDRLKKIGTNTWNDFGCDYHCVAVRSDGTLWGWGLNSVGELGLNNVVNRSSPVQIGTGNTWRQVSVGRGFTAAVRTDNTLWMWGYNNYGQLGQGNTTNRSSPVQIAGTDWSAVICGQFFFTLAVKTNGTLWAWGYNQTWQDLYEMFYYHIFAPLGTGNLTNISSPVQISALTHWTKNIAARATGCFALTNNNTVYTWGQGAPIAFADPNVVDANSNGYSVGSATSPYLITNDSNFVRVEGSRNNNLTYTSGQDFSMGVKADGTLWTWGYAPGLNLPLGTRQARTAYRSSPVQVGTGSIWTSKFSLGANGWLGVDRMQNYFITNNNRLWRVDSGVTVIGTGSNWSVVATAIDTSNDPWTITQLIDSSGRRYYIGEAQRFGSFGINSTANGNATTNVSPTRADSNTDWKFVSGGVWYFLAIKTNGTLWAWGYNGYGNLGDGTTTDRSSPVQIGSATNWAFVDASMAYSSMAITTTGELWAWGSNASGILGDGTTTTRTAPVKIGTGTNWVSCSAGGSLMIKTDGTLWGTGTATGTLSPIQVGYGYNTWKKTHIGNWQNFYIGNK